MRRTLLSFVWRALLGFGPVIAVSAGFVAIGAYATDAPQPPLPDLGLIQDTTGRFDSRADSVSVHGTVGSDVILISDGRRDGTIRITVNGRSSDRVSKAGSELAVFGRGGDDILRASPDVRVTLMLSGGSGDDLMVGGAGHDILDGGSGIDIVDGGAGDDLALAGAGPDIVRLGAGQDGADGGDGCDRLDGGAGDDYLQGGRGADALRGREGSDVLYGLDGRDRLGGGGGEDYLDGGTDGDDVSGGGGRDIVFGGCGDDVLHDPAGDDLLSGGDDGDVVLAGSGSRIVPPVDDQWPRPSDVLEIADDLHGFAARVRSDLETLRSLPVGRELLAALATAGDTVVLRATADGNAMTWDPQAADQHGAGSATVLYNPYRIVVGDGSSTWMHRPPLVGLFHELVHALAASRGVLPPDERSVMPTENRLRAFLGLPLRPSP